MRYAYSCDMHISAPAPLAPPLLHDGATTPVTQFLLVHHGLRRDLHRLRAVLTHPAPLPDPAALQAHWTLYRGILEAHHQAEDQHLFPPLRQEEPGLAIHLDALDAEHGLLDRLLDDVDAAMALLPEQRGPAVDAVDALARMVEAHLTAEEVHLVPVMQRRPAAGPPPGAGPDPSIVLPWGLDGVHPEVAEAVIAGLPQDLAAALDGWLGSWDRRRTRVWGRGMPVGRSRTASPELPEAPAPAG